MEYRGYEIRSDKKGDSFVYDVVYDTGRIRYVSEREAKLAIDAKLYQPPIVTPDPGPTPSTPSPTPDPSPIPSTPTSNPSQNWDFTPSALKSVQQEKEEYESAKKTYESFNQNIQNDSFVGLKNKTKYESAKIQLEFWNSKIQNNLFTGNEEEYNKYKSDYDTYSDLSALYDLSSQSEYEAYQN